MSEDVQKIGLVVGQIDAQYSMLSKVLNMLLSKLRVESKNCIIVDTKEFSVTFGIKLMFKDPSTFNKFVEYLREKKKIG